MELAAIVALTIIFELITVLMRLLFKLRSQQWQGAIGMPRIHHGYIGMVFLLASYAFPVAAVVFWIIGWALILSDLIHHYTVMPLLSITKVDTGMQHAGINKISIRRKILITIVSMLAVGVLASLATSLWFGAIAMGMIYVSEKLPKVLPKFKCPQDVANHF